MLGRFIVIAAVLLAGCSQDNRPPPVAPTQSPMPPIVAATPTQAPQIAPTAAPTAAPSPAPQFHVPGPPPQADLMALTRQLRAGQANTPSLPYAPTNHTPGRSESFHMMDLARRQAGSIKAELRLVTPNAYFYVQDGISVSQRGLDASALELEEQIIPAVRRYINPDWRPGAGIDSRVSIVHGRLSGASGYVTSLDTLPLAVYPYSNERPVVFLSVFAATPGTERYYSVLSHELQHLAHMQANPHQATWLQEGASELFSQLAGYSVGFHQAFLANPDIHLVNWDGPDSDGVRHYGAAYMFLRYLSSQAGVDTLPKLLAAQGASTMVGAGMAGVDTFLQAAGDPRTSDEAVRDWHIANVLAAAAGPEGRDSRYAYAAPQPGPAYVAPKPAGVGSHGGDVAQYAADYFRIGPYDGQGSRSLTFDGMEEISILPTRPPSGTRFWWSNRGDGIAASLTREFDLAQAVQPRLTFKVWYDIERQYDFGYVLASTDGGLTWKDLPGRHSTQQNDLGQSLGWAYTGTSGGGAPEWVAESIDLAPYAGKRVLLRFLYFTDEGINHPGLAFDDIALPEIGFFDDAEGEAGWHSEGFARTDNRLPQRFYVSVAWSSGEVASMPLDAANRGSLQVPPGREGILIITAIAPITSLRARYEYALKDNGILGPR